VRGFRSRVGDSPKQHVPMYFVYNIYKLAVLAFGPKDQAFHYRTPFSQGD